MSDPGPPDGSRHGSDQSGIDPFLGAATVTRYAVDPFARRSPSPRPWGQVGPVVAVAVGGALGGICRYAVGQALPHEAGGFPWPTLTVNVGGAVVLATFLVLVLELWPPRRYVRPFMATGFLGAFTTFSALAVEVDQLVSDGAPGTATAYLGLSVAGGLAAAWLGLLVGRGIVRCGRSDRHLGKEER